MLCGWITTRIARAAGRTASAPRSPRAPCSSSSPSRPRSCAPSPSSGARTASSGVTLRSVAGSRVRNGPPEAVSTMWSMRSAQVARSSGRHWKIAECSLSIGSSVAPPSSTACMKSAPPTTSASLLASSRRLPARAAAMQGGRPAAPTMAAITLSTSGSAASSHSACAPLQHLGGHAFGAQRVAQPARARLVGHHRRSAAGSAGTARAARRRADARSAPTTSKRSGWRATTSSVLVPTDPVEPRMTSRCRVIAPPPSKAEQRQRQRATPAAAHRRGRARRRGRAAAGCCPWRRRRA